MGLKHFIKNKWNEMSGIIKVLRCKNHIFKTHHIAIFVL